MEEFKVTDHFLVPEHTKLSEEEKQKLLEKHNISLKQLPMIKLTDPAIQPLGPKVGDVIRIKRWSPTSKITEFYRLVVNG